jgi:hypothetical protein
MKAKYDFSKAEKGKFYRRNAVFRFPIYLDPDVEASINQIALTRNGDIQKLVNDWLRASIKVVESVPANG